MSDLFDPESAGFFDRPEDADAERRTYFGKHRAFVRDVDDPQGRCRLRAFCPAVMGTLDDENHWLDWADGCFASGGMPNVGDAHVPEVGAGVWIEFEMGDVEHPIWSGCWYAGEDFSSSEAPLVATGQGAKDPSTQAPKGLNVATVYGANQQTGEAEEKAAYPEPLSQYSSSYTKNRAIRTKSGHLIELDDTEGEERIHIMHASGAYVEVNASGGVTTKTLGNRFDATNGKRVQHDTSAVHVVEKTLDQTVMGNTTQVFFGALERIIQKSVYESFNADKTLDVTGDLTQYIGSNKTESIGASVLQTVLGAAVQIVSGAIDITTLERSSLTAGNTSGAQEAITQIALVGDILCRTLKGDVRLETLVGNVTIDSKLKASITALLGVDVTSPAGVNLKAPVVSVSGVLSAVSPSGAPLMSSPPSGDAGLTLGDQTSAQPQVKGQSLVDAAFELAAAVQGVALPGPSGGATCGPLGPVFQNFATQIKAALSQSNKVA